MNIITKVRHTQVPAELKVYAEEKVGKKLTHYLGESDDSIICEIEFDNQFGPKGGLDKRVDLTVTLPHQHLPLHIEESDNSFEEAINKAVDRLDQPLERYKATIEL